MNTLERIPEKKDKLTNFQTKYNEKAKSFARMVGTNIALYVCILLPIILIGFIWTDFGVPVLGVKYISESIATVAFIIIGEIMMIHVGADGGKIDPDYLAAKKEYTALVERVNEVGTMLLSVFCEWQIDLEMKQAITARARSLRLTQQDMERVKEMSYSELKKTYGKKKAKQIAALNRLEPVELNEAILLYDSTEDMLKRGGVPISGEGYMHKKTHSFGLLLSAIFAGLVTASIALTLSSDISIAKIMYTASKVIVLLSRMAKGYQIGARAFNTVEVRQLKAKSNYLRQYIRFVEEETYLKLGDKYGEIECYLKDEATEISVVETTTEE